MALPDDGFVVAAAAIVAVSVAVSADVAAAVVAAAVAAAAPDAVVSVPKSSSNQAVLVSSC